MKIVVLDGFTLNPGDNPWDGVAALGELVIHDQTEAGQILERAAGAEVLVTNKVPLSAETLAQLPDLRFIAVTATGYNIVDIKAARARGIPVANVPVYGTDSVAQFVFALLLELCHHVDLHDKAIRAGDWNRSGNFCFWHTPLIELVGLKLGVIGFGRIGQRVGELGHAFGMEVLAADNYRPREPGYAPFRWAEKEEIFREADVVTLHCPLTPENDRFVNAGLLRQMKPTAFLINTARGPLVHEADLAAALNAGQLAGAGLDVVSVEPIDPANPLLKAKNCILTPHIAWATLSARRRLMGATAENIRGYLDKNLINIVN